MMKVLIIENEAQTVQFAFNAANTIFFNNEIEYKYIAKSQEINWNQINQYSCIFVDISLAMKSDLDGIGIIAKIQDEHSEIIPKIAIITGHHKISEAIKENGLNIKSSQIILKPLRYREIANFISSVTDCDSQN